MGFAGNVEPCFINPTAVAVNDSFAASAQPAPRGGPAKGNWLAQHSAGVMADLDFYIGEEALARSRASSTYSLSYPIRNGQVGAAAPLYCLVQLLLFRFFLTFAGLMWCEMDSFCRWRIGILWRGSGNSASSITCGAIRKTITFF